MQIAATKCILEYLDNSVLVETVFIVKENETVEELIKRMLGDKLSCSWVYPDFHVKLKLIVE